MAVVIDDTLSEAAETRLKNHTGETGGGPWVVHATSYAGTDGGTFNYGTKIDPTYDELFPYTDPGVNAIYYHPASFAGADQDATWTLVRRGATNTNQTIRMYLRMGTGSSLTAIILFYVNSATPYFALYKDVSGTLTQLGSNYTNTLTQNVETDVRMVASGDNVKAYLAGSQIYDQSLGGDVSGAGYLGLGLTDAAYTLGQAGSINVTRVQGSDVIPPPGSLARPTWCRAMNGLYTR